MGYYQERNFYATTTFIFFVGFIIVLGFLIARGCKNGCKENLTELEVKPSCGCNRRRKNKKKIET